MYSIAAGGCWGGGNLQPWAAIESALQKSEKTHVEIDISSITCTVKKVLLL